MNKLFMVTVEARFDMCALATDAAGAEKIAKENAHEELNIICDPFDVTCTKKVRSLGDIPADFWDSLPYSDGSNQENVRKILCPETSDD